MMKAIFQNGGSPFIRISYLPKQGLNFGVTNTPGRSFMVKYRLAHLTLMTLCKLEISCLTQLLPYHG